jgi:hypothetical protein
MMMIHASWLSYVGLFLLPLAGAYFGAYLKRKGENLATHEDLDKLVAQVAAVTETTENIKAAISDDMWDRQKQWEMRRDIVFEVIRALGQLDNALPELCVAYSVPIADVDSVKTNRLEKGITGTGLGQILTAQDFSRERSSAKHFTKLLVPMLTGCGRWRTKY